MTEFEAPLVDWSVLDSTRSRLGGAFMRIYGYFQNDADSAVSAVEAAMRAKNGAAMIDPAAALRSAAEQLGAQRLADLAEDIEMHARSCVETMLVPDDYVDRVAALRPLLTETLAVMDAEVSPLIHRPAQFGRKAD
jgi:HPt (histidine-containing phosphotransfer) domain-containing protein